MASSGKKKTTMAKRDRENKLRERRLDKQARREARKLASSEQVDSPDAVMDTATAEDAQPNEERVPPLD